MQPNHSFRLLALLLLTGTGSSYAWASDDEAAEATESGRWPLCPGDFSVPPRPPFDPALSAEEVEIQADDAELTETGISDFWGNVTVSGRDQAARADHMRYYRAQERAELEGDVRLWDRDLYLNSDTADIELDDELGTFFEASYLLPFNRGRGQADELYHERETVSILQNADYTTCPTQSEFWKISASEITLDHQTEFGSAKHVVLRLKDTPVFYTPYITFPISDKRKSGFLVPSIGSGSDTGLELITPYYWNIAPEMDATIAPRIMSDRGVMLMGEYRYLFEKGDGQLNLEYLPSDSGSDRGARGAIDFEHYQRFAGNRGLFDINYEWASDREYFEDFGTNLELTSITHLQQLAQTRYYGSYWNVWGRVLNYQTIDRRIPPEFRPYSALPQIFFNTHYPNRSNRLNFQLKSQAAYFTRDDVNMPGSIQDVEGGRLDLMPSISYPMRTLASFVEPKAGFRYTQYSLDSSGAFTDSPSRALPFFSLDSGLFFERDFQYGGESYQQTLEPRLFYLYVPEDDQDDLPVFDSRLFDFSFAQLFRENRFTGVDRFGDANQVTLAVTSRLLDLEQGRELGRFSLGQIFYITDPDVSLPDQTLDDDDSSPIVAELATTFIPDWEAVGTIQWDPNDSRTEKLTARLSYNPDDERIVNLSYRVRRDSRFQPLAGLLGLENLEQTDLSFRWPITRQWNVVGRWNYALPESKTLELFGGIEYESCCWATRVVARRYLSDIDGEYSTGVFLQLELKGLTGLGSDTGEFLRRSIRGFNPDEF